MTTNYEIGQIAETTASDYLQKKKLQLITKNYRCQHGEIDLIMKDKDHTVFVEVRFRQCSQYGDSIETISPSKQSRLIRTAYHYLQRHNLIDKVNCRFDVLGLNKEEKIIWIRSAFEVEY